jgi:DNA-binding beta-propeller fold protein YncE
MQYSSARSSFPAVVLFAMFAASIAVAQTTLPAPKFLYSTDNAGGKVHGYLVNPTTGSIKPTGQNPPWAHWGPTRTASDKAGYRLYVINQGSKDLNAYFVNRTNGYLSSVPGSPFKIGVTPTDVKVHPSGHYVYVTAQSNWVYAFHVQSNGSLATVPGSPFSSSSKPQALAIDPQGKYLYVSNYPASSTAATSKVDAFIISSTDGALTPVPGSPYVEPNSPNCSNGAWDMAIHPSGNFLVLPNMCEGIVVYRIGRTTGTLSLVKGSPFPVPYPPGPVVQSVAMDPLGQYLWISSQFCHSGCGQSTDTWRFNATTGVPTYLESGLSGCGLLTRPDPSGKFVYFIGDADPNSGCASSVVKPAIWGLTVNRTNGSLTNVSGSPWLSPNSEFFLTDGLAITP